MGAKNVKHLPPLVLENVSAIVDIRGKIQFYIQTHYKEWAKMGCLVELPVLLVGGVLHAADYQALYIKPISGYKVKIQIIEQIDTSAISIRMSILKHAGSSPERYGLPISHLDSDRLI